ncbi:MAG: NAD(P)H-dependent oxidoreductase, partial [Planctomycetota bacterium]
MKVLALLGSPRRKGNTGIVLERVLSPLRAAGMKVEVAFLGGRRLVGCVECFTCQKREDRPNCPVKDDIRPLLRKIHSADAIVFATPVFCWGASAQLKAVMDRLFSFGKYGKSPHISLLEGKRAALVTTAGGALDEGTGITAQSYRSLADFFRIVRCGELKAVSLGTPEETRACRKVLARAERFGRA